MLFLCRRGLGMSQKCSTFVVPNLQTQLQYALSLQYRYSFDARLCGSGGVVQCQTACPASWRRTGIRRFGTLPRRTLCVVSCGIVGRVRTGTPDDRAFAQTAAGTQNTADFFLAFGVRDSQKLCVCRCGVLFAVGRCPLI